MLAVAINWTSDDAEGSAEIEERAIAGKKFAWPAEEGVSRCTRTIPTLPTCNQCCRCEVDGRWMPQQMQLWRQQKVEVEDGQEKSG